MTQESTGWTTIGEELGRAPMDCSSKYKSIHNNKLKKGPFTAEEDALIRQRVGEWGDKGNGLWAALEKEMGRVGSRINKRSIVLHDCNNMHWTDEMVCILYIQQSACVFTCYEVLMLYSVLVLVYTITFIVFI